MLPYQWVLNLDFGHWQASLTSIHNLFFNEHNRIAEGLFKELSLTSRNTGLELDELVYQECSAVYTVYSTNKQTEQLIEVFMYTGENSKVVAAVLGTEFFLILDAKASLHQDDMNSSYS